MKDIHLWGVKQNNLKNIEVKIPLRSFTVICGPSGSGKSSLAFETLFAEGQRRFIESMSNYARQFLNKAPKPDLDGIENIPPTISIQQKNTVKNSRSTVGTVTEIIDYLRLLYEKVGVPFCPTHKLPISKESPVDGAQKVLKHFSGDRGYVLVPLFKGQRITNETALLKQLLKEGYLRAYLPPKTKKKTSAKKPPVIEVPMGEVKELSEFLKKGLPKDSIYLLIDRMGFSKDDKGRLIDSISQAYRASIQFNKISFGTAHVLTTDGKLLKLSEDNACSLCGYAPPPISSTLFSFNSPVGACSTCKGFGNILDLDIQKVIPNPTLSIDQGVIQPFSMPSAAQDRKALLAYCRKKKIDIKTPWKDLPKKQQKAIFDGNEDFYGVRGLFEYLEEKKYKMHVRVFISRYRSPFPCDDCKGTKLRKETHYILVDKYNISQLSEMTLDKLLEVMNQIKLTPAQEEVAQEVLQQMRSRLKFLVDVGVHYLTLDRSAKTLSGGEYQRLNLANQLGMGLSQVLYVLDEPTIGLHPRDNDRLIQILKQLQDLGNTLVIVEHDQDVIRSSDHLIEMGPGSGHLGGDVLYAGETKDFYNFKKSNTVAYLQPKKNWVPLRISRPVELDNYVYKIELTGCQGNNLKNIDVTFPLNRLICVTGVSGSGKSTLITHTLYPALARALRVEFKPSEPYQQVKGYEYIKNVILIDQSSVGKSSRSNPVTYMKVFDAIRNILASTEESKARGYTPGTFSLNVDGGRCPVCKGLGHEEIDMVFMDNVEVPCDECDGKKFRSEVLEITYKRKNIMEILSMTILEAMDFFVSYPNIRRPLSILKEVGLEYLQLGQSATTLSGGESQRLKVAKEFNSTQQKNTLYILDEPTTGLHFREVDLLLKILNKLIDAGASIVVIEHNLDVIAASDYIVDLGPEAGVNGGKVLCQGTPEDLMKTKKSSTGHYLKEYIEHLYGRSN